MPDSHNNYTTKIWMEEPEADDPFATQAAYCAGYNVYNDILGKASWSEYLFLLFQQEKPLPWRAKLLEDLAVTLANPGMRDHSVLAAMNAGTGGSTAAACLMAALGVGAGQLNGAHEVYLAIQNWENCKQDFSAWQYFINNPQTEEITDIWDPIEHFPGFNPNADRCASVILDSLKHLSSVAEKDGPLDWLYGHRELLEATTGMPLNFSGLAAACLYELGFSAEEGEMLFLLLRLPGAAVHALEQSSYGWRKFPFYHDGLTLIPLDEKQSPTLNGKELSHEQ